MGKIIGIDLGTTNSCVSVMEGGEAVVLPKRFPLPAVLMAIGIATVCIWLNVFFW